MSCFRQRAGRLYGGYPWRYYRAQGCDGFENYIDSYYATGSADPHSEIKSVFAPVGPGGPSGRATSSATFPSGPRRNVCGDAEAVNASLYFEPRFLPASGGRGQLSWPMA
jgi:asparagine synthase (glutamine-hydrolysing)